MIKKHGLSLLIAALVVLFVPLIASAAPWPTLAPEDVKNIMPVSQVKRGMRGYGLTVFHGTKIEKFDVEVLGVLKQMNTGKDLILVRVGGGPITSRQAGVIAGMSGSPCYIKGKMIGAISYGASFAKEPVGMVTPIADMLEAWDSNLPKHASGYSSPQSLPQPLSIGGKTADKVSVDSFDSEPKGLEDGVLHMQPLMTTMMVSGMSQRNIDRLADILKPYGIRPVAGPGGGGATKESLKADLVPGAAIGMSLASGDIDLTGIGTVTYRRGNRIVAFGHPMLGIGAIDAPMTTAYISDIISSYQSSTKLGSPIKTVGRIFQDRPWCIAGQLGTKPKTIPITVTVNDESSHRDRVFHVNVINHPLLAARVITMVADEAISQMHPTPGDTTAMVSYNVTADQIGKISRSNIFFDPTSVDIAACLDFGSLLQILSNNKFQPLDIQSASVKVKLIGKRDTATIDRIFVKKSEFEPGETVDVGVVLRPYKQDRITKTYSIKIPATAPDGKVLLVVRGGTTPGGGVIGAEVMSSGSDDSDTGNPQTQAMGPIMDSGMANADNVKQLITKYLEREKNNEIVLQLQLRSTALNVAGEKLAGMPSAIADVMKSSRNSGLRMEKEEVKQIYSSDSILYGSARLMIDVKRKNLNESKSGGIMGPPSSDTGMGSPSSSDSPSSTFDATDYGDIGDLTATSTAVRSMAAQPDAPQKNEPVVKEEPAVVDKDSDEPDADDAKTSDDAKPADSSAVAKSNVKTVVRQAKTWIQKTQVDFAKGTFSGVSATSENKLELAPTLKKLVETPEQFVWCLASTKGGVYAGTGNSGKIYRIDDTGKLDLFYETGELEVNSIIRDPSGNVYAGTSPHGKIFQISPDGKGKLLYKADEKYILALALDPEGNLYAGVGDAGKIYKINPSGQARIFTQVNEQQVLSLAWDPHGSLLAGTGINGVVYRIDKYGTAKPIFDAPEDSVTSVVSDGDGNAYAGTSTKGSIYKITPDGTSKVVYTKAARVLSMVCDARNNVYAVSDGTLVKISPDETIIQLDSSKDKVQFLSLALDATGNDLYASTGNIGSVYMSKCCDVRGIYESPVHDAKMISKWGRIKWFANTPEGTSVEVRTRTGNVETPDSTWTSWSEPYKVSSGEAITDESARYIQYQVTLSTSKPDAMPSVSTVIISYLTPNQPPTVKMTFPTGGEVFSGKETIKWTGSDPDKDTLTYDVYYSKDNGKDWTALVGGMTNPAAKAVEKKLPASEIVAKVNSELQKSKDVPDAMKKMVIGDGKAAPDSKPANPDSSSAGSSSTNTSYSWNTSKVEDGTYLVKVVASDKTSNASNALSDYAVSEPFIVCNKAPEISLERKKIELKATGSASITGVATSKLAEIAGVQYRVDSGVWMAAVADNGVFDSPSESFTITTDNLATGTHKVEVQAVDTAGNAASVTVEVKVD